MSTLNLDQPPTDSVLRRHYEQLQAARAAARSASPAARPAPTPAATPATPAAPEASGIKGWLGRLFGG